MDAPAGPASGSEVELKLELAPADLARIKRHRLVQDLKLDRPATKALTSVYFDTADDRLAGQGLSMRVRHEGRRRIQCVKAKQKGSGVLFDRLEWEDPVLGDEPEPRLMLNTPVGEVFADPKVMTGLQPRFTTDFRRTTYRLGDGRFEVIMAVDQGSVQAGDASEPINEVELELVRGAPADLYALAESLHRDLPLRLGFRSKAARGQALARGEGPSFKKAEPVVLAPGMSVACSFQVIARNGLAHLMANEAVIRTAREARGVHQMRVALRRLRSAVTVFRPILDTPESAHVKAEMRWLVDILGQARDLDVFLDQTLAPVLAAYPEKPGLRGLAAQAEKARDKAYEHVLATLASQRFTALLLRLGHWIEAGDWLNSDAPHLRAALAQPVMAFAGEVLDKRHKQARKSGKTFMTLSAEERHDLRIYIKKLRYTSEFFSQLFPGKETRRYVDALAELQETLGLLNDIDVARTMMGRFRAPPRQVAAWAWAEGAVCGWYGSREAGLLTQARQDWQAFAKRSKFWSL